MDLHKFGKVYILHIDAFAYIYVYVDVYIYIVVTSQRKRIRNTGVNYANLTIQNVATVAAHDLTHCDGVIASVMN